MKKTKSMQYRVVEPGSSVWNGKTHHNHIWFEILTGEQTGHRISIPLYDKRYSDEIKSKVHSLQESDIVQAILEKEDSSDCWRPTSLEKIR